MAAEKPTIPVGESGSYRRPGGKNPFLPGNRPSDKKTAQLPNALEVCNQIEARNLEILDQRYKATGSTAARVERDRYANILKESCEDRARKKGYFDPINDIRDFLFGGDDQAFRHSPPSPTWPPYKPRPDGGQMPVPAPPPTSLAAAGGEMPQRVDTVDNDDGGLMAPQNPGDLEEDQQVQPLPGRYRRPFTA